MKKKKEIIEKMLVIGIFILFIGTGILPTIAGENNNEQNTTNLTFYTFDKTGTKKCKAELSKEVAEEISELFDELKDKITSEPMSRETQLLKNEFIDLLEINNLITKKITKDYVTSLLNPKWSKKSGKYIPSVPFSYTGSAFICSMAGGGNGLLILPIMLPRPRLFTIWVAYLDAISIASNLYTGHGFAAYGSQFGTAIGFMGVGLSFAFVGAENVETYPPNSKPTISEEQPTDGTVYVPIDLTELSFRIYDVDNDRMSYRVTTNPDIGSGEGYNKKNGVYTIPISGLENNKPYSWTVRVSDGKSTVEKRFAFITIAGPPFDPFEEGWTFRKKITIDHTKVNENLNNFPVLISIMDSDLKEKTQDDGEDILFMNKTGVANKIYHEIERYNDETGELIAWVNVDWISADDDTVFYIYYGNPSCSSQQLPERVWDQNYKAVYHMNYDSGGLIDSIIHKTNCIKILGDPEYHHPGKIGYSINLDRNNYEAFEGEDYFDGLDEMTVEAWINLKKYPEPHSSHCMILTHETSWYFGINWEFKQVVFDFHGSGVETREDIYCPLNTWYYVVGTWSDMKDRVKLFGNGELKDSCDYENSMGDHDDYFSVGYKQHHSDFFDGLIDEVRVSTVQRDDNWIHTTYINLNDPSSFLFIGPEETH